MLLMLCSCRVQGQPRRHVYDFERERGTGATRIDLHELLDWCLGSTFDTVTGYFQFLIVPCPPNRETYTQYQVRTWYGKEKAPVYILLGQDSVAFTTPDTIRGVKVVYAYNHPELYELLKRKRDNFRFYVFNYKLTGVDSSGCLRFVIEEGMISKLSYNERSGSFTVNALNRSVIRLCWDSGRKQWLRDPSYIEILTH